MTGVYSIETLKSFAAAPIGAAVVYSGPAKPVRVLISDIAQTF